MQMLTEISCEHAFFSFRVFHEETLTAFLGRIKQIEQKCEEGDNDPVKLNKKIQLTGILTLWNI